LETGAIGIVFDHAPINTYQGIVAHKRRANGGYPYGITYGRCSMHNIADKGAANTAG
jgi:hypothetical protein